MENIYVSVKKTGKKSSDAPLYAAVAASGMIFLAAIACVAWAALIQIHFRSYLSDLSESTVYAYRNGGIEVMADDRVYRVTGNQVYYLYQMIAGAAPGRRLRAMPETAPDMVLDYGAGSSVWLWGTTAEEDGREAAVTDVCFTDSEGSRYIYRQYQLRLDTIESTFCRFSTAAQAD